jgi:hypothetical protein
MTQRRWDTDERGRGVGDARASLPAIQQLAELAGSEAWVAEDAATHLLPALRERVDASVLTISSVEVRPDGGLLVRLASPVKQSRRELRRAVWAILGAVAELTTLVRETQSGDTVNFEVVTGIPPGEGPYATHGHTLRLEVDRSA